MKILAITLFSLSVLATAVFGAAAPPFLAYDQEDTDIVKHIRSISWMINSEGGAGSGIMFTRKEKDKNIHYLWTAAHVVASNQKVEVKLDPKTNQPTIYVAYPEVEITQEEVENDRIVGTRTYKAQIIRYSEVIYGEDLAVLKLIKSDITDKSVEFYRGKLSSDGSGVWHIGAMGSSFMNSLTFGIVAKIGITKYNNKVYDQYTIPAQRGCSGGGIFLKSSGQCIGLLTEGRMGRGETNFSIAFGRPVRSILEFAKRTKCEWALDRSVPLPYNDDTSIEDVPPPLPKGRFVVE